MLSKEEIIEDLELTQEKFNEAQDLGNVQDSMDYSEKITVVLTWFIQNGYVET